MAADDPAETVAPGAAAGPFGSAAMSGSSVSGPTAALWATDFLNAALLLFVEEDRASVRDVGCWDPLPMHLDLAYRTRGVHGQRAFWGDGDPDDSMLHGFAAADDAPVDL